MKILCKNEDGMFKLFSCVQLSSINQNDCLVKQQSFTTLENPSSILSLIYPVFHEGSDPNQAC